QTTPFGQSMDTMKSNAVCGLEKYRTASTSVSGRFLVCMVRRYAGRRCVSSILLPKPENAPGGLSVLRGSPPSSDRPSAVIPCKDWPVPGAIPPAPRHTACPSPGHQPKQKPSVKEAREPTSHPAQGRGRARDREPPASRAAGSGSGAVREASRREHGPHLRGHSGDRDRPTAGRRVPE